MEDPRSHFLTEHNERRTLIGLVTMAFLMCSVCSAILGASLLRVAELNGFFDSPTPVPTYLAPASTPTPISLSRVEVTPNAPTDTERALADGDIPVRDLRLLASRFVANGAELPTTLPGPPPAYQLGDRETFWVVDNTGPEPRQFQAAARLAAITDHSYWWVESGMAVNEVNLQASAERFENETYPLTRDIFGSESTPGVDNDRRLHIFLGNVPGVGGYFASLHAFTREVTPFSNQREMFFINLRAIKPGTTAFDSTLAHEFQHMIHWHQDRNESTWVNEGMSELASHLNGFDVGNARQLFADEPDLQLNTWGNSPGASLPHYGSSFLFALYLYERFGAEFVQQVVQEPGDGIDGINAVLHARASDLRFDDLFADFVAANYLRDPALADGRYGYREVQLRRPSLAAEHRRSVENETARVNQYGADYIGVQSDGPVVFEFTGSTTARLINTDAPSGRYVWYSNRRDDSNMTLTRPVDLRPVVTATLRYHTWFDIEDDWDYVYVAISENEGRSWQILKTPGSRSTNPSGNAYGPGYTGESGGWIEETVDLSPWAGQAILLRFEYVTDDAVNAPGLALDDIAIPAIGFFDDVETLDPDWVAEGFIRIDNTLRQNYILQVIELNEPPTVTRLPLQADNTVRVTIGQDGRPLEAVLIISAAAPVTTEAASYRYSIRSGTGHNR